MYHQPQQLNGYLLLDRNLGALFQELDLNRKLERELRAKEKRAQARQEATRQSRQVGEEIRREKKRRQPRPEVLPTLNDEYIRAFARSVQRINLRNWRYNVYKAIDRALAHLLFAQGNYCEVLNVLKELDPIPVTLISEVDSLWYHSWYVIYQNKRKVNDERKLSPVDKFRIRKKHPSPTDAKDGKKYGFSSAVKRHLNLEFEKDPKPSNAHKKDLADQFGLLESQISNFFKNRRQRVKLAGEERAKRRKDSISSTTSSWSSYSSYSSSSTVIAENPFTQEQENQYLPPERIAYLVNQPEEMMLPYEYQQQPEVGQLFIEQSQQQELLMEGSQESCFFYANSQQDAWFFQENLNQQPQIDYQGPCELPFGYYLQENIDYSPVV